MLGSAASGLDGHVVTTTVFVFQNMQPVFGALEDGGKMQLLVLYANVFFVSNYIQRR